MPWPPPRYCTAQPADAPCSTGKRSNDRLMVSTASPSCSVGPNACPVAAPLCAFVVSRVGHKDRRDGCAFQRSCTPSGAVLELPPCAAIADGDGKSRLLQSELRCPGSRRVCWPRRKGRRRPSQFGGCCAAPSAGVRVHRWCAVATRRRPGPLSTRFRRGGWDSRHGLPCSAKVVAAGMALRLRAAMRIRTADRRPGWRQVSGLRCSLMLTGLRSDRRKDAATNERIAGTADRRQ